MGDRERPDSLVAPQRPAMRTLRDALNVCRAEFVSDKFWSDMAIPVDKCLEYFGNVADAATSEAAAEERRKAMMCLCHLDDQLQSASGANLFLNEARLVKIVRQALESDESLTPDSELSSVASAFQQQASGVEQRKALAAAGGARLEAVKRSMRPYTFESEDGKPEMTVTIPVPPETKSADVSVTVTRDELKVAVRNHSLQPVIDGRFAAAVDPTECEWHLEGSGDGRVLVLDLEKAAGGFHWDDLLRVGVGGSVV